MKQRSQFPVRYQVPGTWYLVLLLFVFNFAGAQQPTKSAIKKGDLADKSTSIVLTPALTDYCRLLYGCGLEMPEATCPSQKEVGKGSVTYDNERCSEAREFTRRGITPKHPTWGFRLYRFLGYEYRVTYEVTDTLPITRARLEFLVEDIPLAAKLVSHYQDEPYTAEYVDLGRTHFRGTNGKRLRGEAKRVTGGFEEQRLYYLGSGRAEWGPWKLYGPTMLDFSYWEIPGKPGRIGYRAKILVFPGNGMVNSIMNLGLFRSLVNGKINGVLTDISETAAKLEKSGGKDLKEVGWTADEKKKIQTLLALP